MKVRELLELLEDLDGEMEISIAYQPNYPLAADATHVMVRGGEVYICQRCDGANRYAPGGLFESDWSDTEDVPEDEEV